VNTAYKDEFKGNFGILAIRPFIYFPQSDVHVSACGFKEVAN
jgi:hypothetical protein